MLCSIFLLFLYFSCEVLSKQKNVFGEDLERCTKGTGYKRDGYCNTGPNDVGTHVVCSTVSQEFLVYTKSVGNDLSSPRPDLKFKGLKPGDNWCLCALRFEQARKVGKAPSVVLKSTNIKTLQYTPMDILRKFEAERP